MEKINKKIIIKIGSSVLMTKDNKLDEIYILHIADQIKYLKDRGFRLVLVVSGALAIGSNFIDLTSGSHERKQAAAGIGQAFLISTFQRIFNDEKINIAQILLTKDFLKKSEKRELLNRIIGIYFESGIIPVLNENDVIDLNSFGGNDFLAADAAILLQGDQMLILSSWDGAEYGVGGGKTKKKATEILFKNNIKTEIVDGKVNNTLLNSIL